VVDFVHANSASAIGIQLGHAGRKGSTALPWHGEPPLKGAGAWTTLGPSPLAYDADKGFPAPREVTRDDMVALVDAYVRATMRALRAGFDLLELHMAHGYLLSSFLTPLANQRTDVYGGSLENRMRFPLEVFDAVREAWPEDKPLGVRVSATDWVDGAFNDDDAVVVARALRSRGCDFIDVSTGQTSPLARPVYGRMYQTPFSDRIRNEVGIATIAVGNIQDFDQVNTIVLTGRADLCALARPHLIDPYFTLHAAAAQGCAHEVAWPKQYLAARPR
jgi:anthraniloyl-CoA monooxygenase